MPTPLISFCDVDDLVKAKLVRKDYVHYRLSLVCPPLLRARGVIWKAERHLWARVESAARIT